MARTPFLLWMVVLAWPAVSAVPAFADPFDPRNADNQSTEAEERESATLDEPERYQWLDPSKNIYVLQNRKYRKAGRAQLSIAAGLGLSSPFRDTFTIDPRLTYFFNEAWAVEGFFHYTLNTANSTFTAISQTSPAALPQVREYRWAAGGMLQWNPWYSKINVFNSILHFDWHFGVGAAWMQNEVDTRSSTGAASAFTPADQLTFVWGTGHRYYVSESVCVRFDLTGYIYRAPLRGTAGEVLWFSHYTIGLGLGLLL